MEPFLLEWKVFLAGFDWLGLAAAWAYPAACAVVLSLALLAGSRMVLLLVVLLLLGGFVPFGGPLLQGLALILSAIAISHGFASLQRRRMMMQVLEAIAAQDARLDAFMAAIDQRNTLLDRRAMVASQAPLERAEAEPDLP